jgi:hypothetical protein
MGMLDGGGGLSEDEILRVMKKVLPTETTVSDLCLKSMQRCANEFLATMSSEAGLLAMLENNSARVVYENPSSSKARIVKGSDVADALDGLGFTDYAKVVNIHCVKFQQQKKPAVFVRNVAVSKVEPMTYEEKLIAEAENIESKEFHRKAKKK